MSDSIWAEAYIRFVSWLNTNKTTWYVGPPSGVLYCDDEAEAERWHAEEVERPVVVTGQGTEKRGGEQ